MPTNYFEPGRYKKFINENKLKDGLSRQSRHIRLVGWYGMSTFLTLVYAEYIRYIDIWKFSLLQS